MGEPEATLEGWKGVLSQSQPPPCSIPVWSGWWGHPCKLQAVGWEEFRGSNLPSHQPQPYRLPRKICLLRPNLDFFFFLMGSVCLWVSIVFAPTKTLGARRMGGPREENHPYLKCQQPLGRALSVSLSLPTPSPSLPLSGDNWSCFSDFSLLSPSWILKYVLPLSFLKLTFQRDSLQSKTKHPHSVWDNSVWVLIIEFYFW